MKKLLTILGTTGLIATTTTPVIACKTQEMPLGKLSQKELQEKLNVFIKKAKELEKEGDPSANPELQEKILLNAYETYIFVIQVYLKTNYFVYFDNENEDEGWIWTITDTNENAEQYKESFRGFIFILKEIINEDNFENHKKYVESFKKDLPLLEEKLEAINKSN